MAVDDVFWSAQTGKLDALRRVNAGADLNAKDRFGKTAFQSAIAEMQVDTACLFQSIDV